MFQAEFTCLVLIFSGNSNSLLKELNLQVEQLHKIFKLCGTPSDDYWARTRLLTTFRPPYAYKSSMADAFRQFPSSSLGLLSVLLALDPTQRGSAASALRNKVSVIYIQSCIPLPNFESSSKVKL